MRRDNTRDWELLQALERLQVYPHMPLRRNDDDRSHACYDIAREEDAFALKPEAQMVEAVPGRMNGTQGRITQIKGRSIGKLMVRQGNACPAKSGDRNPCT